LRLGTYMTVPVAAITSTAAATDQWKTFSVADAGVRVIAPRLPVAGASRFDGRDPAQPLDTLVAVVERHHQARRSAALGTRGCRADAKGDDDLRVTCYREIEEVDISSVSRLEAQCPRLRAGRRLVQQSRNRHALPGHAPHRPAADTVEV